MKSYTHAFLLALLSHSFALASGENCDIQGGCVKPWASRGAIDGAETNYTETINPFLGRNEGTSPAYKLHFGDDMNDEQGDDAGDQVFALADGKVVFSGYVSGAGHVVILEHTRRNGMKMCSQYNHLQYPTSEHNYMDQASNYNTYPRQKDGEDLNETIQVGKFVTKGQWIGRVSGTRSKYEVWSPHEHIETRLDYPACKNEASIGYLDNRNGTATSWGEITNEQMEEINRHIDPSEFVLNGRSSYVYKLKPGWNNVRINFEKPIKFSDAFIYKAKDDANAGNLEQYTFSKAMQIELVHGFYQLALLNGNKVWITFGNGYPDDNYWVYAFDDELMLLLYGASRKDVFLNDIVYGNTGVNIRVQPSVNSQSLCTIDEEDFGMVVDEIPVVGGKYLWYNTAWSLSTCGGVAGWVVAELLHVVKNDSLPPDFIPRRPSDPVLSPTNLRIIERF